MSSPESTYSCEECGTKYGTREELREHSIKSHNEERAQEAREHAEDNQSSRQ